ncbi:unnamed protein product, partial [Rotaria magnacalcarata]
MASNSTTVEVDNNEK